jgi:hypothetical protein
MLPPPEWKRTPEEEAAAVKKWQADVEKYKREQALRDRMEAAAYWRKQAAWARSRGMEEAAREIESYIR